MACGTMPDMNQTSSSTPTAAQVVLNFWLADGVQRDWTTREMKDLWFGGGAEQDERIRLLFGQQVNQALDGGLRDWENTPLERLALVLLLDQFTRNVYRGSGQAFAGDGRAQQLVLDAIARGWDKKLTAVCRVFLYMPLMHAEDLAMQDECVQRFTELQANAPDELRQRLQRNLDFARQHRDILARFGRFPHRNRALGRTPTPEEEEFLLKGPRFGQ
jgi:uncharacterized protein (DUF924 family)